MYATGPLIRRSSNASLAALISGSIVVGIAAISFILSIVVAASRGYAIARLTGLFIKLAVIAIGVCLFFLIMLFRNGAQQSKVSRLSVPLAASTLGLISLSNIISIASIYSDNEGLYKANAVLNIFTMIALPLTLLTIAFFLKEGSRPGIAPSLPVYAALILIPVALIYAILQLVLIFSDYPYVSKGVAVAGQVFQALTYILIASVLALIVISQFIEFRYFRFSSLALISGICAGAITFIWFIIAIVFTFLDVDYFFTFLDVGYYGYHRGLVTALLVFNTLLYISWGFTLVLIALLESEAQGTPILVKSPRPQAPFTWPAAAGHAQFGQQMAQTWAQPHPRAYGAPYNYHQHNIQGNPAGSPYPYNQNQPTSYIPPKQQKWAPEQFGYPQNRQAQPYSRVEHDSRAFLEQVIKEYAQDENLANQKYRNMMIDASGLVSEVRTTISSVPFVLLQVDLPGGLFLKCFFPVQRLSRLQSLKSGQYVRIRGKVIGKSDYVTMDGCELLE